MNTSDLMQSKSALQETQSVHELMNRQKSIYSYSYILYCLSSINFQFSYSLAGFLDFLN